MLQKLVQQSVENECSVKALQAYRNSHTTILVHSSNIFREECYKSFIAYFHPAPTSTYFAIKVMSYQKILTTIALKLKFTVHLSSVNLFRPQMTRRFSKVYYYDTSIMQHVNLAYVLSNSNNFPSIFFSFNFFAQV